MKHWRNRVRAIAIVAAMTVVAALAAPALAHDGNDTTTYQLTGDEGGSKFEGIGVDRAGRTFYVSEVTGGEIHRGDVGSGATEEWMPEGADGRFTARGITTDRHNNIYIAGGPNGLGTDRPDMWVYSASGDLLAALKVDSPNAFINDVTIGPDGAAYFTNSNAPQVFRVSNAGGSWQVETWLDATGTITQQPGFNLGGIVVSPDQQALIVAQGNVGALWIVDLATKDVAQIDTGPIDLGNADGLVLRGHRLIVIRNFAHILTTLQLDGHASSATLVAETATSADKVFTTGKIARGRLLLIDSKFDEPIAEPPYEVVGLRLADVVR